MPEQKKKMEIRFNFHLSREAGCPFSFPQYLQICIVLLINQSC